MEKKVQNILKRVDREIDLALNQAGTHTEGSMAHSLLAIAILLRLEWKDEEESVES